MLAQSLAHARGQYMIKAQIADGLRLQTPALHKKDVFIWRPFNPQRCNNELT
jgi:hypothetical protein